MTKDDNDNQTHQTNIRLDKILKEMSDRRLESATLAVSLIEKAKNESRILDNDDIEKRAQIIEEHVTADLVASIVDETAALYE